MYQKRETKVNGFSETDRQKARAIVRIFETGRPNGDYGALAVLDDGAGISYGVNQFTHMSGSLLAVAEEYLGRGGVVAREAIERCLPLLKKKSAAAIAELAADARFKTALRAASISGEMRAAQEAVADRLYLQPAAEECARLGFGTALSLAVVYDSFTHGSWKKIRDRIGLPREAQPYLPHIERQWIAAYVEERHAWLTRSRRLKKTNYRTEFFRRQVRIGNWELRLPLLVNGFSLTADHFEPAEGEQVPAARPKLPPETTIEDNTSNSLQTSRQDPQAGPTEISEADRDGREESCLDRVEEKVNAAAAKYDQAERIVTTVVRRSDAAKSLWTTVTGTVWQMAWAVFGVAAGMPKEVWFVVAAVAAALMLGYLYRQIALGKIREQGTGGN